MKKLTKFASLLSLVSVFFVSGCSCSVKEDKYKDEVDAIGNSDLLKLSDVYTDFSATYIKTTTDAEGGVTTETYIVSRDVSTRAWKYTKIINVKAAGEETGKETKISRVVYLEGTDTYIAEIDENNVLSNKYKTSYGDPQEIFTKKVSSELYNSGRIDADYYDLIGASYNNYKTIPFNACIENADKTQIYQIGNGYTHKNDVSCSVEKPLFGKDYTYSVHYRVSIDRVRDMVFQANNDNRLVSVKLDDAIALSGGVTVKESINLTIAYSDVSIDLSKKN